MSLTKNPVLLGGEQRIVLKGVPRYNGHRREDRGSENDNQPMNTPPSSKCLDVQNNNSKCRAAGGPCGLDDEASGEDADEPDGYPTAIVISCSCLVL